MRLNTLLFLSCYSVISLSANKSGLFSGKVKEVSTGYISVNKRKENNDFRKDKVIKRKQSKNEGLEISNLLMEN